VNILLYNLLLPVAFLLYLPVFTVKLIRRGGFRRHFGERFGLYGAGQKAALRGLDRPVWIHAVSVGEAVAAVGFIRRWQQRDPALGFVLSTTTTTGHAIAERKLPAGVPLIYCPVDLPCAVWRALRRVRPRMLVLFEVEFWPNLITQASRRGVPVVLVNGRMSDRSARGYARHGWFFRGLFSRLRLFCVQSPDDVERVRRVVGGAVPVFSCNTMKFDQTPDATARDRRPLLDEAFGPGPRLVLVAGSTHAGEEALVAGAVKALRAEFPPLRLVLVPRHHERTGEVERVLREAGLSWRLLKPAEGGGPAPADPVEVLLVNTTGELMDFYAAADIAYVGKSLAGQAGGHNIIEPAIFAKPILHGSHLENFRLVADVFRAGQATVEVGRDEDFLPALRALCADPARRAELARRARAVVEAGRGAMDRTLDHLYAVVPPR